MERELPWPGAGSRPGNCKGYPRSMKMRFLLRNPELPGNAIAAIIKLFANQPLIKLLYVLLVLAGILKSSSMNTQKRLACVPL
jgi:hypothetical protein